MDTSLEIKGLNCKVQGHEGTPIIGFCIDENCTNKNKFICPECIFDVHFGHKVIKIKELNSLIQTRNNDYKQYFEKEQKILVIYNEHELDQKEKVYKLKRDIINKMEKKVDNFFEGLNMKYNELRNKNKRNFESLKEYKKFCKDNTSILSQDLDLNKLTELCFNIHEEINEEKENEQKKDKDEDGKQETLKNDNNNEINDELELLNKNIDKYIEEQSSSFTNYINENFLKMSEHVFSIKIKFEWCNKTYDNLGFYYKLSNNNSKGTKVQGENRWTILRSKEKLENNFKYKIKCKIGLSKDGGGGFDIGIGKEQKDDFKYLCNNESFCISTYGIINSGKIVETYQLKDNDIVDLEICTKIGNKTFKGSINNKSVYSFNFNLDDIYIMSSMNKISSYIEVLEYYVIPS